MACPKMVACPVFPEFKNRAALNVMQALYCEGEFTRCERYKSISTGVIPPRDLLPDGSTLNGTSRK
jgi:hypothetical protein